MKGKLACFIAIALMIALLAPAASLGEAEDAYDPEIEAILSGMSLEDKIGQMMVVSFRVWKEMPQEEGAPEGEAVNITELNDAIRECLAARHFGGALLFAENCHDAEQVLRLVADMQACNQAGGGLPMLVAADQEGGSVARLGFGTTGPGSMALAATGDPENARRMASIYGTELMLLGINADYAPVMDVNNNPNNPVIGVRSFSDDPGIVSAFGAAYLEGLHDANAIATIKHFPGHGNTDTDSHTGFPRIDASYDDLKAFELVPFQAAIDAGADMVMTAHIQYPRIEKETYTSTSTGEAVNLPATMSRTILTDILRGDMGFEGVVVTDALEMAAIADNFADADVLRMTIDAGADMLLLPCVTNTDLFAHVQDLTDMAINLVERGDIDIARVDESVRRILTLKKRRGLLDRTDFAVTDDRIRAAVEGVGSAANRQAAWNIAEKALTLLKNENGAFPIALNESESALILFADSCASRVATGDLAVQLLKAQGLLPEDAGITAMANDAENGDECLEAAEKADHVILVNRVYNSACLDPNTDDGFSTAVFDDIIAARRAAGKASIVISCQLPYDAARFPDADAVLLCYGSSVMRALPPAEGAGSAYAPNLAAALCACFQEDLPTGKLPVSLPSLDADYRITDQILYAIGQ